MRVGISGTGRIGRLCLRTVHTYTNDQNHLDNPHKDLRRARACMNSIIIESLI